MSENMYLPSSSERKRVITAYLLVGLFFFSEKEDLSVYEYYHYKQALGRYVATMFFLLLLLFFVWIPILRYIPILLVLANLVMLGVLVFGAWQGQYLKDELQAPVWKRFFADLGGRLLHLFDIKKRVYGDITMDPTAPFQGE